MLFFPGILLSFQLLVQKRQNTKGFYKMPKQHNSKTINKVFKELERLGFNIEKKKSGAYSIIPPKPEQKKYLTHGTESSYHPMRRDFKKLYDIDISQLV